MRDDYARLLDFCRSHATWVRETVEALVTLESPSDNKAAADRCGAYLAEKLTAIGGGGRRGAGRGCGDHIRAEWRGVPTQDAPRSRPVLVMGHFDTVWAVGTLDRMPLHARDGRLYGPGIFDMKAGIAAAMLALRALAECSGAMPHVVMLWTADEEIGSGSSRAVIEESARAASAVLVLEPSLPGGAAKTSRKGVGEFDLVVHGVAAHAGLDPASGTSAVHELARQILALEALQDPSRGITVNVGVVGGGSRGNVIADRARAVIDVRVGSIADAVSLEAAVRSLRPTRPRIRLDVTGGIGRGGAARAPGGGGACEKGRPR